MNKILLATLYDQDRERIYTARRLPRKEVHKINEVLGWYSLYEIEGYNLAYAYREFVTRRFTGTTPWWAGDGEKEIGRYLTPAPVIKFMVDLCNPRPSDRIIDFACGSGGFLGEIASRMASVTDFDSYLREKIFACDADEFSVSTAQTFVELLLPGKQPLVELQDRRFYAESLRAGTQIGIDDIDPSIGMRKQPRLAFPSREMRGVLNIFHKNGLFSQKIHSWEKDLSHLIQENSFNLVISNPPGGVKYNLGHEDELKECFPLENKRKRLQNAPLFIQRAIQLVKNGGKICLIVPDGILANVQLKYLQEDIFSRCQVKAVISLPRGIFPNVPSKMSIVYMIKTDKPSLRKPIFMTGVITGEEYNLESELDKILERYRKLSSRN